MAWIADTCYETYDQPEGVVVRRLPSGVLETLAIRGRPGFDGGRAISGVLYRVEWLELAGPNDACAAGAAIFRVPDPPRAAGNCLHLTCQQAGSGLRQWWCYLPRQHDDGTLSLLHEWGNEPRKPRRALRARFARRPIAVTP